MIRMRIRGKLFLTLLVTAVLVAVGMLAMIQWNFDRSFLNYVNALEQQRLESLVGTLEQAYGERGSWEWLQEGLWQWRRLLRENAYETLSEQERQELQRRFEAWKKANPQRQLRTPPAPPVDGAPRGLRFENRVVLLDAGHKLIVGPEKYPPTLKFLPLIPDGEVVGYLGLIPQTRLIGVLQRRFAHEQKRAFLLISLGVLLVAGLLSLPLSRTLVRRIAALAAGTFQLASGNYTTRVDHSGTDELSQLAADFNRLAGVLEENEQGRKQWIADISHELRTPLTVLRSEVEALQDGIRQPTPEALNSLHGEILQLTRLVEDLYQLSLSDLGSLAYRLERLDPLQLLRHVVDSYRGLFAGKQLTLDCQLPQLSLALTADRQRLQQLFENLLENSLRYTDPGGSLQVDCRVTAAELELCFADSAPGVAPAELPRLFERLFRAERSRNRESGGSGLGLSICANIVAAHGGTISAEPSPLGGVKICLKLPLGGDHD